MKHFMNVVAYFYTELYNSISFAKFFMQGSFLIVFTFFERRSKIYRGRLVNNGIGLLFD